MINKTGVYVIAEIGVNHNGDLNNAFKLIDIAKDAGANAVKFQSFDPRKTKLENTPFAEYQKNGVRVKSSFEMSMKYKLSSLDHIKLKDYCDNKNITFLSTGFDRENIDLLDKLGMKYFKIGSGEITNFQLLKYIAKKNKPVIMSTGMADLHEIDEAYNYIREYTNKSIYILHCVSLYPTPIQLANLNFLTTLKNIYGDFIGFSDHVLGFEAGIIATALGAKIIEKHITLDKNMSGPDHKASMNPEEFKEYVKLIRNTEVALGNKYKIISEEEIKMREVARRSIATKKCIRKGEIFTEDNICIKKPGNGIAPKYIEVILGREATQDIGTDCLMTWEMVGIVK